VTGADIFPTLVFRHSGEVLMAKSDRRVGRRTFCKVVGLGFAVPFVISARALGREEKSSANERVGVAMIGVGGRGRDLFRAFVQHPDVQVLAVVDCYRDRRESIAALCGAKATVDFREALALPDVDAVVIATPDHWHVPIAVAAAKAGKHAYVEKPLGLSIEQDLICRKVFAETGRVFQYGTQQRSMGSLSLGVRAGAAWGDRQRSCGSRSIVPMVGEGVRRSRLLCPRGSITSGGLVRHLLSRTHPIGVIRREPIGSMITRLDIWPVGVPIRLIL
jgi:hypothetical protein